MCKVLKVSRSCYYRWYGGNISNRAFENQRLTKVIEQLFKESRNTYGSPRIIAAMKKGSVSKVGDELGINQFLCFQNNYFGRVFRIIKNDITRDLGGSF